MSAMPWTEGTHDGGVKLTYDDFLLFPDDGLRHELIDGRHYVTASPNLRHQRILGNLFEAIRLYLRQHPVGEVFIAPFDVIFSKFDVVEPDLLYISHERAKSILTPDNVRGVPELVVEVGSKSTHVRDETIKRELYERTGVAEYWTIDTYDDVIRVYRHADGTFPAPLELHRDKNDALTTPLLPGFSAPLAAIFPPV